MNAVDFRQKPGSPEDILHYGVKGMRWGIRRDPKTGIRPIAKTLNDSKWGQKQNKRAMDYANKQAAKRIEKRNKEAGMDPATIFIASYATMLASLKVAQFHDSGNARVFINKGKRFITREGDVQYKRKVSLAKKNMTEDQLMKTVVADINKNYGSGGTKMNCRRCTIAYEMRRRGYDVQATHSKMATGQHGKGMAKAINTKTSTKDWGENVTYKATSTTMAREKAPQSVFKALSKEPNGSRGEVAVGWLFGGGHSVAYEIVNNKPVIFDTQRGLKIKTPAEFVKAYDLQVDTMAYSRLDNKPLNEAWVERWVRNND